MVAKDRAAQSESMLFLWGKRKKGKGQQCMSCGARSIKKARGGKHMG